MRSEIGLENNVTNAKSAKQELSKLLLTNVSFSTMRVATATLSD